MRNISDIIENYLKNVLDLSESEIVEIKRSEIADKFQCVPSQINYVINTRFTIEKGYVVESKRGGGGYIRIMRVKAHDQLHLIDQLVALITQKISQNTAADIVFRLVEEDIISEREAKIMLSVMDRSVIMVELPERDILRGRMLRAMLDTLKYE
ncbi:CtsR family transcriptional regulator [Rossellomorea marisflavi]|uniref:Transcriptional regulator CtsR n=1 Tax=Rossellomorea marisflavi TaxID=189381 RepID=A0A0J5UQ66_9BACI|nr:CtsR family transcriptional regulator [Rossellomorea marisflavi]KMK90853.1 CtsR family transcriptional regulator [Rossellomorea marisflavi]KML02225.1 CtsR family transcriptional regulator [Rossellomorea marisflavi]KML26959.1 CtsR family transcriptional regulator [Rossellomorea marisflavi]KZE48207.1 CtsR family transcriptional regulator [Rossellomorea marisflavi]MCM2606541.1 CtsR family transcriptional regulator [Rossellomorea marisflavi]